MARQKKRIGGQWLFVVIIGLLPSVCWAKSLTSSEYFYGGKPLSISSFALDKPVALVILKSAECPVCSRLLGELFQAKLKLRTKNGKIAAVLLDQDVAKVPFREKTFLEFPLFRVSKSFLVRYEFWDARRMSSVPGVLFLDRCGKPSYVIQGRSLGMSQVTLIHKVLRNLADEPSACGMIL